jgi:hypothetical protein
MLLRFLIGLDGSKVEAGADEEGTLAGEMGRDGWGVFCEDDGWRCFFFLRTDASVPEASDKFGLPGRLRDFAELDFFIAASRSLSMPPCFSFRPDGVLVPVDDMPDFLSASAFSRLAFFSSSTR